MLCHAVESDIDRRQSIAVNQRGQLEVFNHDAARSTGGRHTKHAVIHDDVAEEVSALNVLKEDARRAVWQCEIARALR